jgi:hypothetical protein
MRPRFVQAFLLWISLAGFIPAALACAQTMAEHDCCPPGHHMPCDTGGSPGSVEAAACCATPSLAPSAIQAVSEQHAIGLPAPHAASSIASLALPASIPRRDFKPTARPPDYRPDRSFLYLQTARLRL